MTEEEFLRSRPKFWAGRVGSPEPHPQRPVVQVLYPYRDEVEFADSPVAEVILETPVTLGLQAVMSDEIDLYRSAIGSTSVLQPIVIVLFEHLGTFSRRVTGADFVVWLREDHELSSFGVGAHVQGTDMHALEHEYRAWLAAAAAAAGMSGATALLEALLGCIDHLLDNTIELTALAAKQGHEIRTLEEELRAAQRLLDALKARSAPRRGLVAAASLVVTLLTTGVGSYFGAAGAPAPEIIINTEPEWEDVSKLLTICDHIFDLDSSDT